MAVAAVQRGRGAAAAQVVQRLQVRGGHILDVDVVAHAGAVGRGIVRAEHAQLRASPERDLAGDLEQQGGVLRALADARLRIAAGDVEVAQHHVAQRADRVEVAQHPLAHQLGASVGIDRLRRRILAHAAVAGNAVHRGGGREHEVAHAGLDAAFEQAARLRRIVAVVAQRVGDRLRHDRSRGEMHDRADGVFGEHALDQCLVADLPDHQRGVEHGLAKAGAEVVEHDDAFARLAQLAHDVAADVAGAAGDQDRFRVHRVSSDIRFLETAGAAALCGSCSRRRPTRIFASSTSSPACAEYVWQPFRCASQAGSRRPTRRSS